MSERNWTPEQRQAIEARGGTLLVSAAAGSGKTAVLVERVIGLLCDPKQPVSADRLLICTFSRAAAAEMKQRISMRLSAMIQEAPANLFLQRQQALLGSARISTVHSFCADLIRHNFQHVAVTPEFEVMDQTQSRLMMEECAGEVIEKAYTEGTPVFMELVELLSSTRDDRRLQETILKIHEFARSHPFYEGWLEEKLAMYHTELPVEASPWGKALLEYAFRTLSYCVDTLSTAIRQMACDERYAQAYLPAFQSDLMQIDRVREAVQSQEWDVAVELLRGFLPQRLGSVRGDDPVKRSAQAARQRSKDLMRELSKNVLNATREEYVGDIRDLRPKIEILFGLVKRFGKELDAAKTSAKKLDYSDLEHLALSFLVERIDGRTEFTEHAKRLAQQYDYVMVDEYQDTNEVQDLLFRSVSRNETNLFMVGDVKQSIYSFRQAMPEIFLRKKQSYPVYREEKASFPASILLDRNFRSRNEVTGCVNFLFSLLMSREIGDLDYNEAESLRCGAQFSVTEGAEPEFHLIDAASYQGEEDATLLEARQAAARIRQMLEDGYRVQEGGVPRACEPRDFCILMRSPRRRSGIFVNELHKRGIAAASAGEDGFLHTREVSGVVSLLRAVVNPLLDMELLAAMLSPLLDFTDDEIVAIRLLSRTEPLYLAVGKAAEEGDSKCGALLELLLSMRRCAATCSAPELLQQLYAQTGALEVVSAMPLGEMRCQNLLMLVSHAADYHNAGYKGAARFVGLLDRLLEHGDDLEPASAVGDAANLVRVMSVHRSKGLEFPIVFLADTARPFNLSDLRENTLLHSEYGFACQRRDHQTMRQFPTLPMGAIRLAMRRTQLSEELRMLYVALTRAKEKLIVFATQHRGSVEKKLDGLMQPLSRGKVPEFLAGSAGCWSDWIAMALLHHPSGQPLREAGCVQEADLVDDLVRWSVTVSLSVAEETEEAVRALSRTQPPDGKLMREVRRRMSYTYPAISRTRVPTKLAVSDVVKGEQTFDYRFTRRPRFLEDEGLTAAERGNAMHKFMQFADYQNARDRLADEIDRMGKNAFLSPVEIESLSRRRLRAFFQSSLAKRMFASDKILRELRFMAEFGQDKLSEILPELDWESRVVLQGVADCVFLESGGAVIIDYKTDYVEAMDVLAERYRSQLMLYREILSECLELPVKACILYSFSLSEWIDLA